MNADELRPLLEAAILKSGWHSPSGKVHAERIAQSMAAVVAHHLAAALAARQGAGRTYWRLQERTIRGPRATTANYPWRDFYGEIESLQEATELFEERKEAVAKLNLKSLNREYRIVRCTETPEVPA